MTDVPMTIGARHTWSEAREIARKVKTHSLMLQHTRTILQHDVTMTKLEGELAALPLRHQVEVGKLNIELDTMDAQHRNRMLRLQVENIKLEQELAALNRGK